MRRGPAHLDLGVEALVAVLVALALPPVLVLLAPAPARAGTVFRILGDNDYFDFWLPQELRPDNDYTQGLTFLLESNAPPRWFPALAKRGAPCAETGAGDAPCAFARYEVGQEIYTPDHDAPEPISGQRPYAAWLFLGAADGRVDRSARRVLRLRVGVTGLPALGEAAQISLHRVRGFRTPLGWDHQVPFEPALWAAYEEQRFAFSEHSAGGFGLDVVPFWSASAGNFLTCARLGLSLRSGFGMPRPWELFEPAGGRPVSLYALGSVREDWVLHDLTLDGSTFGASPRVAKRPFVLQIEFGGGLRAGPAALEYRVIDRGREYDDGPRVHRYGSLRLFVGAGAFPDL